MEVNKKELEIWSLKHSISIILNDNKNAANRTNNSNGSKNNIK